MLIALPTFTLLNQIKTTMGKGDKKSRKGKIFMGSYGVSRPRKKAVSKSASPKKIAKKAEKKAAVAPKKAAKKAAKKED